RDTTTNKQPKIKNTARYTRTGSRRFEGLWDRTVDPFQLGLQSLDRRAEPVAPRARRLGEGRIGIISGITDPGLAFFNLNLRFESRARAIELADGALQLGNFAHRIVNLEAPWGRSVEFHVTSLFGTSFGETTSCLIPTRSAS